MKYWEYMTIEGRKNRPEGGFYDEIDDDYLDLQGRNGWELVCVLQNGAQCVFKKELVPGRVE